jgi:hypothetical protein
MATVIMIPKIMLFKEIKTIETVFDWGTFTADNMIIIVYNVENKIYMPKINIKG